MNLWNKFTDNFYRLFIKNLLISEGRASRIEYIIRTLTTGIIIYSTGQLKDGFYESSPIFIITLSVPWLIIFYISVIQYFFLSVRRLHDFNCSGLWHLLLLFPFGQLIMIILALYKGNSYTNKYGDPPAY